MVHLRQGRGNLGAEGRRTSTSAKTYDLYFRPKVRSYFPNPPATATEIQAQFKSLGIDLKIHTEDNKTYLTNSNKGQYSTVPARLGR